MSRPISPTPVFGVPRYYQGRPNTSFIVRYGVPHSRRRRRP